ncbi:conserved exported hypothetical protein [Hyella patelloides LEGE 07179]|uniref:Uncharacterized protein n=1 Tax=Hyella patelloides LEGE 07179 TaxID=945734 RepID=A0A563VYZ9_9CYAN|nr:hypothetical protein [Hyella patelloides]VEP16649.1 conserved exported hypothetical protein [Hyella patelloides LEGE 07179]
MAINFAQIRRFVATTLLVLMVATTTACSSSNTATLPNPTLDRNEAYTQLERGDSIAGQKFGDWVVSTSQGMITDSYVRDNNKLGVVISEEVNPTEVQILAKALTMGFHKNFPNQDLTILMYAPDKERILTAKYDVQSNNIEYQA